MAGIEGEKPQSGDASSQEQGELDRARAVLRTIVNTHEDTIDEGTPFDRIAGLSTDQIRQAERIVAQSIHDRGSGRAGGFVTKKTQQGTLEMYYGPIGNFNEDITAAKDWVVGLALYETRGEHMTNLLMSNSYALTQPSEEAEYKDEAGFEDRRPGGKRANLGILATRRDKGEQVEDIRFMWRGLRWMNVNLLSWDSSDAILPEVLDSPYYRNSDRPSPTQAIRAREFEEQMRAQLQAERERRGEGFNGAEYVREQLASEASQTEGERQRFSQSLLTAFDAVAYPRYISAAVKEDALNRLAKAHTRGGYVEDWFIVSPHVAGTLDMLTNALAITHRPWGESSYHDPYDSEGYAIGVLGKSIHLSSKAKNDLIEKSGGKLERWQQLDPRYIKKPTE